MRLGKSVSKCAASLFSVLLLSAVPALADVASFTYSDLDGDFNSGTTTFTANNQAVTSGDVTRLLAPTGTSAIFDFDTPGIGVASFNLTLLVGAITTTTASSIGALTIRDINGDKFSADVAGTWSKIPNPLGASFSGVLSDFTPDDSGGNGSFEGNTSGSFSMDFGGGTFPGNVITLAFGGWFTNSGGTTTSFSNKTTLASGAVAEVVPTPGAALLGLVGLGLVGRMKRKVA